jgi:hypothetical protein
LGSGGFPFFGGEIRKQNKRTGRPDRATMRGISKNDRRDEDDFHFFIFGFHSCVHPVNLFSLKGLGIPFVST